MEEKYEFFNEDKTVSDKKKFILLTKTVEQKTQFTLEGLEQEISRCDEEISRQNNMKAEYQKMMLDSKKALGMK